MSTRSTIGIKRKDGTVKSIYCHSDGYLEYNGLMLYDFYKDQNKIEKLLNLGDISLLNKHINPEESLPHGFDFDERQADIVVAYARDRGDKNVEASIHNNIIDFNKMLKDSWCKYAYLYDEANKEWEVANLSLNNDSEFIYENLKEQLEYYDILNEPIDKLDNLLCDLVEYEKEFDHYQFNDCYESDEDAYNNIRDLLTNEKGIDNYVSVIMGDLTEHIRDTNLSSSEDIQKLDTGVNLVKQLSEYKNEYIIDKEELDI